MISRIEGRLFSVFQMAVSISSCFSFSDEIHDAVSRPQLKPCPCTRDCRFIPRLFLSENGTIVSPYSRTGSGCSPDLMPGAVISTRRSSVLSPFLFCYSTASTIVHPSGSSSPFTLMPTMSTVHGALGVDRLWSSSIASRLEGFRFASSMSALI